MPESTCSIHGCLEKHLAKGWCSMHYNRWLRHGDPLARVRGGREWLYDNDPWNKVFGFRHTVTAAGCWEWTGYRNPSGYGQIKTPDASVMQYTHRVSFAIVNGPIPEQMTVDHLCFNPPCIRPTHLRLLSNAENAGNTRGAWLAVCGNGHEYTEQNTYWRVRRGRMMRQCKACGVGSRRKRETV